jgi:hypothetical protein
MKLWGWWVVTIVLSHGLPAHSGEKKTPPSKRKIRALIDQLVSPNRKPIKVCSARGLPRDFDRKKQKQVDRACTKLTQLGPRVFPYLIERWEDKRYCLTASNGLSGAFLHLTVGQICRAIIYDQLQPYGIYPNGFDPERNRARQPRRPGYPTTFLGSQKAAREWWKKNKRKTLYQMQLQALDWVIAEEAKRRRDFTDKERKELQQLRKRLVKGGKPLPVKGVGNFGGFDVEKD